MSTTTRELIDARSTAQATESLPTGLPPEQRHLSPAIPRPSKAGLAHIPFDRGAGGGTLRETDSSSSSADLERADLDTVGLAVSLGFGRVD